MSIDLDAWRKAVEQATAGIADEEFQRRAWFGGGPEVSSPGEVINQFLGDAAVEQFLDRKDVKLSRESIQIGRRLVSLIREILKTMPTHIPPAMLIDDPRWRRVREIALAFSRALTER